MYKIYFDTKVGVWRVAIQKYGIFWSDVCKNGEVCGWENIDKCEEFVKETGIGKVYRNYSTAPVTQFLNGYQPAPPNTWTPQTYIGNTQQVVQQ